MEQGSRDAFTHMGTLGVEEEFFVVDERGRPTSGTDELVYETDPPERLAGRLDHELFKCVIEAETPRIGDPGSVREHVSATREALVDHAREHGFDVAAAGLHPAARWRELEHAEKPRYRSQLDRIQYPQHRNTTAGLHVHVGVDDADKATWVANEVRWHLPQLLALSANSPFWNGFDSGLESARAKVFEALPNTGMPTEFEDYDDYRAFERRMIESGSIRDRGELWFDVRPHTEHGTVEVRTPDAQADVERVVAFTEYIHALVVDLAERYEDGERGTSVRREVLDANKWHAIRHGRGAEFLRPDEGVVDLETWVAEETDRLGVTGLAEVLDDECCSSRQRRIHEEQGVDALCDSLRLATDSYQ
jgi:carboxylate-amine ligase